MLSLSSIATALSACRSAVIDPLCRDLDSLSTGKAMSDVRRMLGPPAAEGSRDAIG